MFLVRFLLVICTPSSSANNSTIKKGDSIFLIPGTQFQLFPNHPLQNFFKCQVPQGQKIRLVDERIVRLTRALKITSFSKTEDLISIITASYRGFLLKGDSFNYLSRDYVAPEDTQILFNSNAALKEAIERPQTLTIDKYATVVSYTLTDGKTLSNIRVGATTVPKGSRIIINMHNKTLNGSPVLQLVENMVEMKVEDDLGKYIHEPEK